MSGRVLRGLHARLTGAMVGIVAGVLTVATLIVLLEMHYHFAMYERQIETGTAADLSHLNLHLEAALVQSILWTTLGALLIAVVVSLVVAKRITAPLVAMRRTAERMTKGQLEARTVVEGADELYELGRSINQLAEQLQRQEELRKTMTTDIAHELRTPLTTLKSHMEAFQDGVWEPTPVRIRACYEEIERLIHLVRELESLTHMESPDFALYRRAEDLAQILQQATESTRAAFLQKGIELHVQVPDQRPHLAWVDRERVMQIIINLLSNALKFTPSGGTVQATLDEDLDRYELTIVDTGIGIDPEDLPYVFERFYRAEKSRARSQGGGGIGLTIVKRLVEAHGGTIAIQSQVGQGTSVHVHVPKT